MFDQLSETRIFRGLLPSEIRSLLNGIHYQLRSYDKDEMIAYAGDVCDHLMLVTRGAVKGEISSMEGGSIVVSEIPAPNTFAEAYLFASKNNLRINIRAMMEAEVMFIHRDYLNQLMEKDNRILKNYMRIISNRFLIVTNKLNFMMIKTVKGRIAYYFLNMLTCHPEQDTVILKPTHHELAVFLGVTRPALTKNLNELKKEGIIAVDGKTVRIPNRERLVALIR